MKYYLVFLHRGVVDDIFECATEEECDRKYRVALMYCKIGDSLQKLAKKIMP